MDKSGGSGGGAAGGDSRDGGPSPTTTPTPPPASSSPAATAVGPSLGCGTGSSSSSSSTPAVTATPMTLNVTTTTGGSFSVVVDGDNSVENLKKIISKKLKVSKDRICLLHRERELHDGSLRDNGLMDGSKLILTPNVETGLLAQRAENTVMQALESLNDNQVNDFLSGKSPLNLSVRLGDHMMLIQLQLSTLNPSSQSGSRSKTHKSRTITGSSSSTSTSSSSSSSSAAAIASTSSSNLIQASSSRSSRTTTIPIGFRRVATTAAESSSSTSRALVEHVNEAQTLTKQEIENIHSIVKNLAESGKQTVATVSSPPSTSSRTEPMETDAEPSFGSTSESPIKSLSNLVSSSINANIPPGAVSDPSAVPICTDPISANLTSCLCKRLDSNDNNSCESNCLSRASPAPSSPQPSTSASVSNLHRTAQNPIMRHKSKVQTLKKHISFDGSTLARTEPDVVQPVSSMSAPNSPQRPEQLSHHYQLHQPQPGPSGTQTRTTTATSTVLNTTPDPNSIENPALAEASRNLTQTLRKLSKRVFTNKVADVAAQEAARNVNSGAVIESMKHHGKGIYSGTFSGTLNPALQDKFGRPKRDISTIIHILNDLLSAAPQCARSGTKIYFEPSQSAASQSQSNSAATALTSSGGSGSSAGASGGVLSGASGSSQTTAAHGMGGASSSGTSSFTTPVAAPSPRLVSRCVPTPIQTKKFPSNGTITSATIASGANGVAAAAGPTGSNCTNCTSSRTISLDPAVPSTSRSCYHHHHHHHHHQHHGHAHQQQKVTAGAAALAAPCKVLCKCGHPLAAATTASTQCQRCAAISAAELENSKTKSKLDSLRLIMQQKKERREARKQKCAPYSTTTTPPSTSSTSSAMVAAAAAAAVGASGSTPAVVVPHRQAALTNTSASSSSETSPESTTTAAIASDPGTAAAQESSSVGGGGSSSAASSAATATATATTTTSAAEAAQSHQLVEEVDTVA